MNDLQKYLLGVLGAIVGAVAGFFAYYGLKELGITIPLGGDKGAAAVGILIGIPLGSTVALLLAYGRALKPRRLKAIATAAGLIMACVGLGLCILLGYIFGDKALFATPFLPVLLSQHAFHFIEKRAGKTEPGPGYATSLRRVHDERRN